MNPMINTLRETLMVKWHARFDALVRESKSKDVANMTPEEAYRAGVRNGYWDAVVDMVASGLVKIPALCPSPGREDPLLDNVH